MLLSYEFPPHMFGGVGTYMNNLALTLAKHGVKTLIVCGISAHFMGRKQPKHSCVAENLEKVMLPTMSIPPRPLWFEVGNFREIIRQSSDCDIIHTGPSIILPVLKRKTQKPLVATVHGEPSNDLRIAFSALLNGDFSLGDVWLNIAGYPYTRLIWDIHIEEADHLVVIGRSLVNDLGMRYGKEALKKSSVIYHAINFDYLYSLVKKKEEFVSETPTLFFAGRLYWRKGISYLLKATQLLLKRCGTPNFKLKIFGAGPLRHKVIETIRSEHFKNKVSFHGFVPYSVLISEMYSSDIVVAPTLYEAGPSLYVLEAMALRKPVIGFDLPFIREVISNEKTGILVKTGDVRELANAISHLLEDGETRELIGKNAFSYVHQNHNWDSLIDEYLKIYRRCLE